MPGSSLAARVAGSGDGDASGGGGAAAPDVPIAGPLSISAARPSEPLLSSYVPATSPSKQQQPPQAKRWSVIPANSLAVSTTAATSRTDNADNERYDLRVFF